MREMMYGIDSLVTLKNGKTVPAVNLDNAATTPPFKNVWEDIVAKMEYYGSIGRGTGQKSVISSEIYMKARKTVMEFVNADQRYTIFYTNSTTDGMNKLASALVKGPEDLVLTTRMEHFANDLPWRERGRTVYVDVDEMGRLRLADFERILNMYAGRIKYVTVAAASNVTGYVNNVHQIAAIAHRHGARMIVDGAQIIAHRKFSMLGKTDEENIDFFVFSAHKMYSPFGGGAVVGLRDILDQHMPVFYGGGMLETVTDDSVFYEAAPDLYEAGSPNYPGIVGMAEAIRTLNEVGFAQIESHEQKLLKLAIDLLSRIPGIRLYGDNVNYRDRVGILIFTLRGVDNETVSQKLADYSAIAVRQAAFCAHPYVRRLSKEPVRFDRQGRPVPPKGLVRVSFGIYNDEADVHILAQTLRVIAAEVRNKGSVVNAAAAGTAVPDDDFGYLYKMPCDRG
ncbi:MAG: aminotransferase class V-fold PLP-dependent enzyme [Lachnospiraceae bacterium]